MSSFLFQSVSSALRPYARIWMRELLLDVGDFSLGKGRLLTLLVQDLHFASRLRATIAPVASAYNLFIHPKANTPDAAGRAFAGAN